MIFIRSLAQSKDFHNQSIIGDEMLLANKLYKTRARMLALSAFLIINIKLK